MSAVRRTVGTFDAAEVRLRLTDTELQVLRGVVEQLAVLLGELPTPSTSDPLAELVGPVGPVEPPADPALRRLFPDGYRDDPAAAEEFRRFTQANLRAGKQADLAVVRRTLEEAARGGALTLDAQALDSWLRVLTDARLVLGVRLGIETEEDAEALAERTVGDEAARAAAELFEWLGIVLDELVSLASGHLGG